MVTEILIFHGRHLTKKLRTILGPLGAILENTTMNDWLIILEAFRDGKFPKYYYGLTPRFIIGGCQIPVGNKFTTRELAYEATKQMFDEMRAFNNNGKVVVSVNCGVHNGKVMALSEKEWTENTIATSFEEIWGRYGEEIVNGTYHIDSDERKILETIFHF